MKERTLLWQLYASYLLIILASVTVVTWYALHRATILHKTSLADHLYAQATILEQAMFDADGELVPESRIKDVCQKLSRRLSLRITILTPSGRVIADTHEAPGRMDNHLNRPEILAAMRGEQGTTERYSQTIHQKMMYLGIPIKTGNDIALIVRLAIPMNTIQDTIQAIVLRILLAAGCILLVAAFLALAVSKRVTHPLRTMREGALRFAQGDFSLRIPDSSSGEINALTHSMNTMAAQLDDRIKQLFYEKQTREAVFYSMAEGLIAIDAQSCIIHINPAAASFLKITNTETAKGESIERIVRNDEIQQLLREAMSKDEPVKHEIRIKDYPDRLLVARGTALRNPQGMRIGALLVMQDVTQIRHLEKIRQEFVANVSHELKTPITSIKGFAETLLDDAGEDPDTRQRFLKIIARQTDHLNAIISDLLLLSSVEHFSNQQQVALEPSPLRPLLESAIATCQLKAEKKQVTLALECDNDISISASPHLFEQAVINLVDNAIKYSPEGNSVRITVQPNENEWCINIRDQGPGIERQFHNRLFERFYRVDKGRSRHMGGTGLGLAIVKHIATVHGGSVSVESTVGTGSTFSLHIPKCAI